MCYSVSMATPIVRVPMPGYAADPQPQATKFFIDAGVGTLHVCVYDNADRLLAEHALDANADIRESLAQAGLDSLAEDTHVQITGKLRDVVQGALGRGERILPAAALWAAARAQVHQEAHPGGLALVDLSASGYMLVGVDETGALRDDTLIVNPRCGAGSGVNLDRVLQKLGIAREEVDRILAGYLGETNRARRQGVNIRADRCGVFASSATISDKNQGVPLDFALAVTLKSVVLKACQQLPSGFQTVWLTGRVFAWAYARECAADHLSDLGVTDLRFDRDNRLPIEGLRHLEQCIGPDRFARTEDRVRRPRTLTEYPGFEALHHKLSASNAYHRLPDPPAQVAAAEGPLLIGLDVGSTMAKLIVSDAGGEKTLFRGTYSNSGDTIDTVKTLFRDLAQRLGPELSLVQIGITGSARYQVQQALARVYPPLADRISVLVENYAHARGSLDYAREHLARLEAAGIAGLNRELCILVDIGGEDTKVSTIALERAELLDNAMNVKCSAGTGSLMDTLTALFGMADIAEACRQAYNAERGWGINATCAVFLMENARKLQAQGYPRNEILASANWAIVDNMAQSLWRQVRLPPNTLVLLHGQTMLSEPLPLAVTERLGQFVGGSVYALVPPEPGHRACYGLIRSGAEQGLSGSVPIRLREFIERRYQKRIIQCKGAACGDKDARCNRTHLSGRDDQGRKLSFSLGGCTAINELLARKGANASPAEDSYKAVWDLIDRHQPRSEDPNRLVIARSFAVSEWAHFFARMFEGLGVPVHVDRVRESDILQAQPHLHVDTCAPHMGAVGQYRRLAAEPHGVILAPQIEYLPVRGSSLGRTCTINQGGPAVAKGLAETDYPDARIHLFTVDLSEPDPSRLAMRLYPRLGPVFEHYDLDIDLPRLTEQIAQALHAQTRLHWEAADLAAELAERALEQGRRVALVLGREYILNPGTYDSHVGRLLHDQGMAAIPSYLLDPVLAPELDHLYWRNPHLIATLAEAAARRRLHRIVGHPRLRELFRRIETGGGELAVIQVSTFLCGPDSVTAPLIAELTRQRPYLLIQSDAVIKELAHLENRMSTYVRQLDTGLHAELLEGRGEDFDIGVLQDLVHDQSIDTRRDVIYFPTLGDNRSVTAVMRAAGFTCIDNYSDEGYDLPALIKAGRRFTGDSVCAPLAAVYGDVLGALEDFKRRRAAGDPRVTGKQRLLIFNNKGLGPCRQGQYVETHKVLVDQLRRRANAGEEGLIRFLVGHEHKSYDFGLEPWTLLRAIQGVVLQGVLHQLLFDLGGSCRDFDEYERFLADYRDLKERLYAVQEQRLRPSERGRRLARRYGAIPGLGLAVRFFAYRFHSGDLQRALRHFVGRWRRPAAADTAPIRIHVDGEAYMRVAQIEEIFRVLLATLGLNRFRLAYTPAWGFLDYKLAGMRMHVQEDLEETRRQAAQAGRDKQLQERIRETRRQLVRLKAIQALLRHLLAAPLYRAAGLKLPTPMWQVLETARTLLPTRRPDGELAPYLGEALLKLGEGYDLLLNIAPEGCMVSSMAEAITPAIARSAQAPGRIQHLFSQQGDVDEELLALALLKTLGPEQLYSRSEPPV
jgi:activator of 2-hydroxyglutaryl-CoA dehydratase/predicted nucleotide-binding protein (sugar kinase/HSP70/actin superfamily)